MSSPDLALPFPTSPCLRSVFPIRLTRPHRGEPEPEQGPSRYQHGHQGRTQSDHVVSRSPALQFPLARSPGPISLTSWTLPGVLRTYDWSALVEANHSTASPAPLVALPTTGETRPISSQDLLFYAIPAPAPAVDDPLSDPWALLGILTSRPDELVIYNSLPTHTIINQLSFNSPKVIQASDQSVVISTISPATPHIIDATNFNVLHTISSSDLAVPVFSLSRRLLAHASAPPLLSVSPTPPAASQRPSKTLADISMALDGARKSESEAKTLAGDNIVARSPTPQFPLAWSPNPMSLTSRTLFVPPSVQLEHPGRGPLSDVLPRSPSRPSHGRRESHNELTGSWDCLRSGSASHQSSTIELGDFRGCSLTDCALPRGTRPFSDFPLDLPFSQHVGRERDGWGICLGV
ncbi:Breast carcinoma amplified sequence [Ceratobasidium sp. AG-Ba]|nr:Breast carcinoma amplified sequence [Ceratobasidium sp. AG-Ba]